MYLIFNRKLMMIAVLSSSTAERIDRTRIAVCAEQNPAYLPLGKFSFKLSLLSVSLLSLRQDVVFVVLSPLPH
jgi:hypothetical protein